MFFKEVILEQLNAHVLFQLFLLIMPDIATKNAKACNFTLIKQNYTYLKQDRIVTVKNTFCINLH